jgi:glycosyltransferase involved in cell wall biosynthesis
MRVLNHASLGGIAELFVGDLDGVLVAPNDPAAWRDVIAALARDPAGTVRLRAGIRSPRTMDHIANDMVSLYNVMLEQ